MKTNVRGVQGGGITFSVFRGLASGSSLISLSDRHNSLCESLLERM